MYQLAITTGVIVSTELFIHSFIHSLIHFIKYKVDYMRRIYELAAAEDVKLEILTDNLVER